MSDTTTKWSKVIARYGCVGRLWFIRTQIYVLYMHPGSFPLVVATVWEALFWPAYLSY